MTSAALYRDGCWRRRDPLAGLNPALCAVLEDALAEPLACGRARGPWRSGLRARTHLTTTVSAAARRGLLRLRCDDLGANGRYALTAAGLEAVHEIQRRAKARTLLARASGRGQAGEAGQVRAESADLRKDPV